MSYEDTKRRVEKKSSPQGDKCVAKGVAFSVMGFLLIVIMLIGAFASGAWSAFVTAKLYAWFVVPLGTPPLNWWHIWGLLMVLGAILTPYIYKDSDREDTATQAVKFFSRIITIGLTLAISLLLGWIVKGQI